VANVWDTSTADWLLGSAASTYADGNTVTFSDVGSATPAVNITATVSPGAVKVASANNYTIGGSPIAGSASLIKSGAGTLTLSGVNTYTGSTTVSGGRLVGVVGGSLNQ